MAMLTRFEATMKPVRLAILLLLPAGTGPSPAAAEDWHPAQGPLMTRWARDVSPGNAHAEYPRPQMVRTDWKNLNGLWDYAIRPKREGQPAGFDGKILVPFPV